MTDITLVSFDPLQDIRHPTIEEKMQVKNSPSPTIAGVINKSVWLASRDDNGVIFATLSGVGNAPPRERDVRAFFRHWGIKPVRELTPQEVFSPSIRTFVVSYGVAQPTVPT